MPAKLVVIAGPDAGKTFVVATTAPLVVGRGQASGTRLVDPRVSRAHCEVRWDGANVVVSDSSSVGGTLVNGSRVTRQALRTGDVIRIGETEMRFEQDVASDVTLPPDAPVAAIPAAAPSGPILAKKASGPIPAALRPLYELEGKPFGRYQIKHVIAPGMVGVVFLAAKTTDQQTVALKVFKPDFTRNPDDMQRFVRGMKTARALVHPNVVSLVNAGFQDKFCWVAMEYVEGESLAQVIRRAGPRGLADWKLGLRVAVHVARALAFIHANKIVHRNVTPSNVLVRKADNVVKLGDVMLAKALEGAEVVEVTEPGELVGNVFYMSPERTQAKADEDGRSDCYGLAATLYHLLTGKPPFTGTTLVEFITKIRQQPVARLKTLRPELPDAFDAVILKCLAKLPAERYQTAAALLTDLDRIAKAEKVAID